jgi:hypothetical protein
MGRSAVAPLFILLLRMSSGQTALAQALSPGQDRPPPGSDLATLAQMQRWFELDAPFSRGLKFSFDTRSVPTFEALHLPTFEGRAVWQRGSLNLSLFERVAPALELDCRLTCAPVLEQSLGFDARASLGRVSRQVPETFLFVRGEAVRMPRGFAYRSLAGVGGLLDF